MHIGFDVSQTGRGRAGCGFFAHAMAEALMREAPAHRYSLYPSFGDAYLDPLMPLTNPYRGRDARYGPRHLTRETAARFWNAPDLEARLGNPDIVHANNFWAPIQLSHARLVYTCYDLGFMREPGWTTEANRIACFDGMFRAACVADWIVAISAYTAADFLARFPHFPEGRVRVIHPASRFGGEGHAMKQPAALKGIAERGFWLTVGTIEPRKNQRMLARAYAASLERGGAALPLVFAGGSGWLMEGFEQELQALGIRDRVILAGYVSDAELAWLYAHCRANLYASRFEGFGLPVLEAMQFGAACVVSNASSLPEVAGDAAILLPAEDENAWRDALVRLATDEPECERLRAAGRNRARAFDAAASARALDSLYEEAVAAPRRASLAEAA
jgi:glycosyltransferase involved in cell wall biosynthesis